MTRGWTDNGVGIAWASSCFAAGCTIRAARGPRGTGAGSMVCRGRIRPSGWSWRTTGWRSTNSLTHTTGWSPACANPGDTRNTEPEPAAALKTQHSIRTAPRPAPAAPEADPQLRELRQPRIERRRHLEAQPPERRRDVGRVVLRVRQPPDVGGRAVAPAQRHAPVSQHDGRRPEHDQRQQNRDERRPRNRHLDHHPSLAGIASPRHRQRRDPSSAHPHPLYLLLASRRTEPNTPGQPFFARAGAGGFPRVSILRFETRKTVTDLIPSSRPQRRHRRVAAGPTRRGASQIAGQSQRGSSRSGPGSTCPERARGRGRNCLCLGARAACEPRPGRRAAASLCAAASSADASRTSGSDEPQTPPDAHPTMLSCTQNTTPPCGIAARVL